MPQDPYETISITISITIMKPSPCTTQRLVIRNRHGYIVCPSTIELPTSIEDDTVQKEPDNDFLQNHPHQHEDPFYKTIVPNEVQHRGPAVRAATAA